MSHNALIQAIEEAWAGRDEISPDNPKGADGAVREALDLVL